MSEIYPLIEPITVTIASASGEKREEVIKQLVLTFPEDGILRAKHLRETDGHDGTVGMTLALLAAFSDQPMKVLDELSEPDFVALFERVSGFRKPGRRTGETA